MFVKQVGATADVAPLAIEVDSSANIYLAGQYTNVTVDFDSGAGTTNLTNAGGTDIFLAKYDSSGNIVFARGFGNTGTDKALAVDSDSSGNSYVAGEFAGTIDFDPGAGTTNLTPSGSKAGFFGKYDTSGNLV